MTSNRLHRFDTAEHAARECAAFIVDRLRAAIDENGRATIAVSGGSTPKLMFAAMRDAHFPWERLDWFFADERAVPPGDKESNYKLACDHILEPLNIPAENVFRVEGELGADAAASRYEAALRSRFALQPGAMPVFDVVQLGMGPDGHTASLFPGSSLVFDREGLTAAVHDAPKPPPDRITLLPRVLLAGRSIVFLLAGEDKRRALEAVLSGPEDPQQYPTQIFARSQRPVEWFVAGISGLQWPE
jgi:6-phosphogluconolactonase